MPHSFLLSGAVIFAVWGGQNQVAWQIFGQHFSDLNLEDSLKIAIFAPKLKQ